MNFYFIAPNERLIRRVWHDENEHIISIEQSRRFQQFKIKVALRRNLTQQERDELGSKECVVFVCWQPCFVECPVTVTQQQKEVAELSHEHHLGPSVVRRKFRFKFSVLQFDIPGGDSRVPSLRSEPPRDCGKLRFSAGCGKSGIFFADGTKLDEKSVCVRACVQHFFFLFCQCEHTACECVRRRRKRTTTAESKKKSKFGSVACEFSSGTTIFHKVAKGTKTRQPLSVDNPRGAPAVRMFRLTRKRRRTWMMTSSSSSQWVQQEENKEQEEAIL